MIQDDDYPKFEWYWFIIPPLGMAYLMIATFVLIFKPRNHETKNDY